MITLPNVYSMYNVVGTIHISTLFKPNGNKIMYKQLELLRKDKYDPTDRIVVVYDCADRYSYTDLPGDGLVCLQKYLTQLDITNCFVLIVSSNKNIANECKKVKELYSTDENSIECIYVDGITTPSAPVDVRDTFCVLPWMHLYIGPDGNVLPCCVADQKYPIDNIRNNSVDSILKSKSFDQLRKNMLSNQPSKECSYCYAKEDANFYSPRKMANKRWKHLTNLELNRNGTITKINPVYLDIRLNNICNLKCRMCSGYFSSSIAAEENKIFNIKNNNLHNQERKTELVEIISYLPSAEKIYFAGGEPLITPEHYEILNALIKCNNTNLEIFYNTNFTKLNFRDISVTKLWSKFTNIKIGASLDAIGKVAEYIRAGTVWEEIEQNLARIKQEAPHVNFTVTSTVGFMNVTSLIELQRTWHDNQILDISKFSLSATISPDHMTICILPNHHKLCLDKLINEHIKWCSDNNAVLLASQWNNVLQYMWSADYSHHLTEFKRITNLLDGHRGESFVDVFPEFKDLICD